jgi:hypothetical protein
MRFILSFSALAALAALGLGNSAIAQTPLNSNAASTTHQTTQFIAQTMEQMGVVNSIREGIVRVTTEDGTLHLVPLTDLEITQLGIDERDEVILTFEGEQLASIAKDEVVVMVTGASVATSEGEMVEEDIMVEEETVVTEEEAVVEETVVTQEETMVIEEEEVTTQESVEPIPALW